MADQCAATIPTTALRDGYHGPMASSDPSHDFGSTGAERGVRVSAESIATVAALAAGIAAQPDTSIALVLGFVAGSNDARSTPGRVAALCDELHRRGLYATTLAALDLELAQRIELLYRADRGQRWRTTGRRG